MLKNHNKRLLVIGANGLLGDKIFKLAEKNHTVVPTHRSDPLHANSLRLDVTDTNNVLDVLGQFEPNIVIHTASETNVDKCETQKEQAWKTNVEGACNIADACQEMQAKLVYISTDYVFDGEKGSYSEEEKPNPINYYGITKFEGEKQVIQRCEDYLILRTSVLYGRHPRKQNFATWIIESLKQSKEIAVVEDHYNTPTLANNLAEMTIEAVEKDLQGLYHASGSERISRYEFARKIAKAFNLDQNLIKPIEMSQLTAWVAKRPKDSSLNISKIEKELKTKPLNITEGLSKMKEEKEA